MPLVSNRNFALVLTGQIVSLLGGAVQRVAISLYLLELTGSAGTYGLVLALSALPYILLAPTAGAVADAFNRRSIMVTLDVCSAVAAALFAVTLFADARSVPLAAGMMVFSAVAATFYTPAVTACIPQIVPARALIRANGAISQVGAWANILGPVVAGVLYGWLGMRWVAVIHAAAFAFSAALELLIRMPDVPGGRRRGFGLRGSLREMRDLVGALRRSYPVVWGILLSYGMFNVFVVPVNTVLFPSIMMLEIGVPSQTYGVVEAIAAAGLMLGGLAVTLVPRAFEFGTSYRWNFLMPALLALMGLALTARGAIGTDAAVAVVAASGMGIMFVLSVNNVVTLTYNQTTVPVAMLGSLAALTAALASSATPVGQVLFGQLAESGCPYAALLFAAAVICVAVCLYVRWNVRRAAEA